MTLRHWANSSILIESLTCELMSPEQYQGTPIRLLLLLRAATAGLLSHSNMSLNSALLASQDRLLGLAKSSIDMKTGQDVAIHFAEVKAALSELETLEALNFAL